jgi:molecular chaperone GrpE
MSDKRRTDNPGFQVADKRFWVADESAVDRAATPVPRYPSFVEELKTRTEASEAKLRERLEQLETENAAYRARLNRQLEDRVARGQAALATELLEVVDNLQLAMTSADAVANLEALRDGVALNLNLLLSKLRAWGVERIETLNLEFDPAVAEALTVVAVESPDRDNRVVEVVREGYRIGDQVLRPALVKVGRYEESDSGARSRDRD